MVRFAPASQAELDDQKRFEESLKPEQRELYKTLRDQQNAYDNWTVDSGPLPPSPDWAKLLGGGVLSGEKGAGLSKDQMELFKKGHMSEYLGWLEAHDGSGGWGRGPDPDKFRKLSDPNDPFKFDPLKYTDPPLRDPDLKRVGLPVNDKPLTPQQEQAYLRALGYDVGGLDKAPDPAKIEAAKLKFAKDNIIKSDNADAINKAIREKIEAGESGKAYLDKVKDGIANGTASKDDVKTAQWIMKGKGNDMPKSTNPDGTVDGILGKETKGLVKKLTEKPEWTTLPSWNRPDVVRLPGEGGKINPLPDLIYNGGFGGGLPGKSAVFIIS